MAGRLLSIEGFLLSKDTTGESHLKYYILAENQGLILCLKRRASKSSTKAQPDLFDYALVELEQPTQSNVWFIRDYQLLKRFQSIGNDYPSFFYASNFARILTRTLNHADYSSSSYNLCAKALESWESNIRPDVVFFKSLYLFAGSEGYPIKEHWWNSQSAAQRNSVASVLKHPVNEQSLSSQELESLINNLKQWITEYTEILV